MAPAPYTTVSEAGESARFPSQPLTIPIISNRALADPQLIESRQSTVGAISEQASLLRCTSQDLAVRPEGAKHLWRRNPPG